MKTEIIEHEWITQEKYGDKVMIDTTTLVAIKRPKWTYVNADGTDDRPTENMPWEVGEYSGSNLTIHSADEAKQYIALLEKVVEKFEEEVK